MENKEELKKQVIVLGIILLIVIVIAIILNINKNSKYNIKGTNNNEAITNSSVETKDEMMKNLKGLIEEETGETELKTDNAETTTTSSNEMIKYQETEYENY